MPAHAPAFVDRRTELRELRALSDRPGPALALLYRRRRVGKTYLLDEVWDDVERFYYLATDSTPARNRMELIRELGAWTGRNHEPEDFPTWQTVFRRLAELAGERPIVDVSFNRTSSHAPLRRGTAIGGPGDDRERRRLATR